MDEDVDVLIGELLKMEGFKAITARDAGQLGKSDADQLNFAARAGFAILTHNRVDFQELHRQYITVGRAHAGIIIATRRRPYDVANRLLHLLNQFTTDEMRSNLIYI